MILLVPEGKKITLVDLDQVSEGETRGVVQIEPGRYSLNEVKNPDGIPGKTWLMIRGTRRGRGRKTLCQMAIDSGCLILV